MGLICYSVGKVESFYCKFMAQRRPGSAVEVRLDLCHFDEEQIKDIFSTTRDSDLVAAAHIGKDYDRQTALRQLSAAILAGADFVDISLDLDKASRQWLISLALNKGCRIIISYHNYSSTPAAEQLRSVADAAFCEGADIVKIVTTAHCDEDNDTICSLYKIYKPQTLIAFAMGKEGIESRLESYYQGAPLFYLSPRRGYETAPGQFCYYDFIKPCNKILKGVAGIPCSKSMAQRAILLAALTEGQTKLYNFSFCDDSRAALSVAESLYAEVTVEDGTVTIVGHQDIRKDGLRVKDNTLFVGESGLMARLCIPLAGLSSEPVTITGEKTLLERKVSEHRGALKRLGLNIEYTDRDYLPVKVSGKLKGGNIRLNGIHGSQMISGLTLALSQCDRVSHLHIDHPTSVPYIGMTSTVGAYFGLKDTVTPDFITENDECDIIIDGMQQIRPVGGMKLEKDWSSAAFFLVAGAMMGSVTIRGLKFGTDQADETIYDFLDQCNVDIVDNDKGDVNVRKSIICPFTFDLIDAPDLFAPLVLLALRACGECCIYGLDRLKNKESNRARTFVKEFRALGADMFVVDGALYIEGNEHLMLRGGKCSSHGDHRLAMALEIASLISENPVEIDDIGCIAKSFPGFMDTLDKLKKKR